MIPPELYAQIRRLFYGEHWRVGTIASTLGVHPDTVRRAIEHDRFIRIGSQIRPSLLDPYKAFVAATLDQYPRPAPLRLRLGSAEAKAGGAAKTLFDTHATFGLAGPHRPDCPLPYAVFQSALTVVRQDPASPSGESRRWRRRGA